MKIAVCAIGKLENQYIQEWVSYHCSIGIDKIYLYDNNDTWGEYFDEELNLFINSGFVEIINYRGKKVCQCEAYQDCYNTHKNEYDWIAFIDCDEFLTVINKEIKNLKDILALPKFDNFDMIHINYITYGDNNLLVNDNKSVQLAFKEYLPFDTKGPLEFPNNYHCKSIIRGKLDDSKHVLWVRNVYSGVGDPHSPVVINLTCCNADGIDSNPNASIVQLGYENLCIRHYSTKTISEAILNKFRRGFPDQILGTGISELVKQIGIFFSFNQITNEKLDFAKTLIYDLYEKENNLVVTEARGRIGNTLFTIACGRWYAEQHNMKHVLYINHDNAQYIINGNEWYTDYILKDEMFKDIETTDNLDLLGFGFVDCYEKNSVEYNELPVLNNTSLFIHGFRQNTKYLPSREKCREYFLGNKKLFDAIKDKYGDLSKYVSINIRRGDYLNPANDWIVQNNPLEWYNKIISKYKKTQKFLVVSDDIEWCKEQFRDDRFIFCEGIEGFDKIFVDLYIQTLCKDNVISNSTFSWWAAYLNQNNKRKVYYKGPWYKVFDCEGIIPENDNWIDVQ